MIARIPNIITASKVGVNARAMLDSAVHGLVPIRTADTAALAWNTIGANFRQFGRFRYIRPVTGSTAMLVGSARGAAYRGANVDGNRLDYTFPPNEFMPWTPLTDRNDATVIVEVFKRTFNWSIQGSGFGLNLGARLSAHMPEGLEVMFDVNNATGSDRCQFNWFAARAQFPEQRWHTFAFVCRNGRRAIWINGTEVASSQGTVVFPYNNAVSWSWFGAAAYGSPWSWSADLDYGLGGYWNRALSDDQVRAVTRDSSILKGALDRSTSLVVQPGRILRPTFDIAVRGWSAT
jgi:hypothetical protein